MTKAVSVGSQISPSEKILLNCKPTFAKVKIAFIYINVACAISCVSFFAFAVLVSIFFFPCMLIFIAIPF